MTKGDYNMLVLFEEGGPELTPDLIAALPNLDGNSFSHFFA
jgi:hypothetical protein